MNSSENCIIKELKILIQNKNFKEYSEYYVKNLSKLSETDFTTLSETIKKLNKTEKQELKICLLKEFPQKEDAHVFYLISKTKTKTKTQIIDQEVNEKIKRYFFELNKSPQIQPILKLMQFNHDLEIIFDFDADTITQIEPTSDKNVKGRMDTELEKIYIGARIDENDENKLLGTIAHELCHLAMQMLFNNQAKPYEKNDNANTEKFKILNKKFLEQIKQGIIIDEEGILKFVYENYKQDIWDAELIVRIPHILALYEERAYQILKNNAQDLLDYYNEVIIPKLNEFIENSYLIRPKKNIEYINLKLNYLYKIEESHFRIQNPIDLNEALSSDKLPNIVLIKSSHNFNSCISVYQYLTINRLALL